MKISEASDKELHAELAKREKAKSEAPKVKNSPDFSTLRKMIEEGVAQMIETRCEPKDFNYYVYETAMEAVYGKQFWKWFNVQDFGER